MEDSFPFTISRLLLKLEAQAAPEEPVGRYEDDLAVAGGKRYITLSEQIAAIRQNFGMAGDKSGEPLANLDAEVWIDMIRGLAVGVLRGDSGPADPFIAGDDFRAGARNGGGESRGCAGAIHGR